MLLDRYKLSKRLDSLVGKKEEETSQKDLQRKIASLEKQVQRSTDKREERLKSRPKVSYPVHLPIFDKRTHIIKAIRAHQVVIISGETGSGKSTQIPKMCLAAGRGIFGKIGCTQPRRIAAMTVTQRIAEELGQEIGKSVGYKIRFKDRTDPKGYIKIMTDGMLLAETQHDPYLNEYDTIIVDEAHERNLNIDFLLGILKGLLNKRKELKLIITSATIDTKKFSAAFDDAPVIHVEGRLYPVEVRYMPSPSDVKDNGEITYVDMAVRAVRDLKKKKSHGDMLIFMPTEQDIRDTCEILGSEGYPGTTILPLFARLTAPQQHKVFSSIAGQKIVVATNVAETSITIPGIRYVIDTGLARIPKYLPRTRTTSLLVSTISRSSADQRKGRCGRVENGICIRLYSEQDYESRSEYTSPEVLRSNLAEVILRMLSLKLGDISAFPFVDRPDANGVKDGFRLLKELGAVTTKGKGFDLTAQGREMAQMPMDPRVSRMMLEARKEGCIEEVSIIASALSIQDPRERPLEKAALADQRHAPFKDKDSDFVTLLNIWNRFNQAWDELKTQNKMRKFARENFLSFVRMREWKDILDQIRMILKDQDRRRDKKIKKEKPDSRYDAIHRAVLSGYLYNIAQKKDKNIFQAARGREVMLFPGSVLFNKGCPWIVAAEMVKTSRLFARTAARIDSDWLEELGGDLCKSSYSDPYWSKSRGEVRASEQVSLYGLIIVPKRTVSYGRINPHESHGIFVQRGLVEGEIRERFSFLSHNQKVIKKLTRQEDMLRRKGILVSAPEIAAFYSERLEGVCDIRALRKVIKKRGGDDSLKMTEEDLLMSRPDEEAFSMFPSHAMVKGKKFQYSYRFAPGKEDDGVTISIPSTMAQAFPRERLEWVVPGLFREKITALIKGLPKRYRKQLVPVPEKVDIIVDEIQTSERSLITTLAEFIYKRFGLDIPASEWPVEEIPDHLKMRVSIVDQDGKEIESGRDVGLLEKDRKMTVQKDEGAKEWQKARKIWERTNITSWDFGTLPDSVPIHDQLTAYPGLEPAGEAVNLRLFPNMEEALINHKMGVKLLFTVLLKKEIKFIKRVTTLPKDLVEELIYFGDKRKYELEILSSFFNRFFYLNIRRQEDFLERVEEIEAAINMEAAGFMEKVGKVIHEYHLLRTKLHGIETSNKKTPDILMFIAWIRKDLDSLIPRAFHEIYGDDRFDHLSRYMRGMAVRAERGTYDLNKDQGKSEQVEKFSEWLKRMFKELSIHTSEEKRAALEEFRWQIEEYKVSLFAPELKTAFPISRKRLEKKVMEIERMI